MVVRCATQEQESHPITMVQCLALLCLVLAATQAAKLPNEWERCPVKDEDCFKKTIPAVFEKLKLGAKEFNIPPLAPLHIPEVKISAGNGPVNVAQNYKNLDIVNLLDVKLESIKISPEKNDILIETIGQLPVNLLADYDMNGRILLLPIQGEGKCNLTLENLHLTHHLNGDLVERKNKQYLDLKTYNITMKPSRVYLHFEGLFNNNKELGDNMNNFLNENWEAIFEDVRKSYEQTFGLVFLNLAKQVFNKVPISSVFAE